MTVGGNKGHTPVLHSVLRPLFLTFRPSLSLQRGSPVGPTGRRRLARRRTWSQRGSNTCLGRWSTNTLFPQRAVSQHAIQGEAKGPPLNCLHWFLHDLDLLAPTFPSNLLRTPAFPSIGWCPRRWHHRLGVWRWPTVAGLRSTAGPPRWPITERLPGGGPAPEPQSRARSGREMLKALIK